MHAHSLISLIKNKLATKFDDPILCEQYAGWLLQWITQRSELDLIATQKVEWTDAHQKKLDDALDKLINQDMPLAYLLGSIPFAGLDILIHPPILIPRSETEDWVCNVIDLIKTVRVDGALQQAQDKLHEWPVRRSSSEGWETSPLGSFGASIKANGERDSNQPLTILDLCTGSGCIALAFADAFPHAKVYGTDINEEALELARKNAKHNHISNVTFLHSNLFDAIPKDMQFDLIVANPPYIPDQQWSELELSVKNWEDKNALVAPDNGMALIKKIIEQAPAYLKSNPPLESFPIQLAIEIDATQGSILSTYLKNHGYTHVGIIKDLEGKDRVVIGRFDHVAATPHS